MEGIKVELDRDVVEELFVIFYSVEEMVVRGFLDPKISPKADVKTRLEIIDSIDANAKQKAKKLLDRVRR